MPRGGNRKGHEAGPQNVQPLEKKFPKYFLCLCIRFFGFLATDPQTVILNVRFLGQQHQRPPSGFLAETLSGRVRHGQLIPGHLVKITEICTDLFLYKAITQI